VVHRTAATSTDLISGNFPILDVNVALILTLRCVLAEGDVSMSGVVTLAAGDTVVVNYVSDGFVIPVTFGSTQPMYWSIFKQ
jgi:hypothetical protein